MVGVCIFCQKVIHSFDIRKKQTLSVSREDLLVFLRVINSPFFPSRGQIRHRAALIPLLLGLLQICLALRQPSPHNVHGAGVGCLELLVQRIGQAELGLPLPLLAFVQGQ